ncbi:MAG TPA: HIT domain-containing protein [Acidimicrobiales bacterium]|nr:HIT domain-containing protein [Acidimicrobiales bacterium]
MSQLRLDPMTGRWVVIAGERAQRPSDFLPRRLPVEDDPLRPCPFCPGQDSNLHPVVERLGPDGKWEVRVVPNLYPAFSGNDPMVVSHLGPVFTQAPASGVHDVIVLSQDHNVSWADLSPEHSALIMDAIRERMLEHSEQPGLRYSQAVVNSGREAGASIEHPHGQLLSMPFIPGEAANELAGFARFSGNCLLCAVLEAESEAAHRIIYADDRVAILAPFWSGTPYEMLLLPRSHETHLHDATGEDLAAIGRSVQLALSSLRSKLGDVAYNLMFHSAPFRTKADFHWHVHVVPKISTRGGFEMGSGVLINVVPPERAAEDLRSEIAAHA